MVKQQVLICDDNRDTLSTLEMMLSQDFEVEVISLQKGLEVMGYLMVNPTLPDLMILDLMLPDLEGDDLIQMLRKKAKFKDIPIILMSGIIENVSYRAGVVGADGFLSKPFSLPELKQKVAALLQIRRPEN